MIVQPQVKHIIKIAFLQVMHVAEVQDHYLLQPTTDSNAQNITEMKEDISLLKQDRAERKATEEKLINEIVKLKNETTSAEFERVGEKK